jgi:hypothetical protein
MQPSFLVAPQPTVAPSSAIAAALRCVAARTKLVAIEIESAAVALAGGFINQEQAIAWASDAGLAISFPSSS